MLVRSVLVPLVVSLVKTFLLEVRKLSASALRMLRLTMFTSRGLARTAIAPLTFVALLTPAAVVHLLPVRHDPPYLVLRLPNRFLRISAAFSALKPAISPAISVTIDVLRFFFFVAFFFVVLFFRISRKILSRSAFDN